MSGVAPAAADATYAARPTSLLGVAPLTWADADKQFHAAADAKKAGAGLDAGPVPVGLDAGPVELRWAAEKAARSQFMHAVPPLSWADADKAEAFYAAEAAKAARNAAASIGPPIAPPAVSAAGGSSEQDLAAADVLASIGNT